MRERSFRNQLTSIVVIGALWRLVILAIKWHKQLLLNDSFYYSVQAAELATGHGYVQPFTDQPGAEHGPLTSTLMAIVSFGHNPVPYQRIVTMLGGIATLAVIGLIGRRLAGNRAGLFAAAIAAVYPNLWMNDGLVMSESVSVLVVVLWLLAMLRFVDRPMPRSALLVGVLLGLAALARSELIVLLALVAVFCWFVLRKDGGRKRLVAIVVGAAVVTISPWVIYNLSRFQDPVTLSTNDGTTLAGAYCDRVFHGPELGGWSLLCLSDDPLDGTIHEPSVMSAHRRTVALDYLRHHLSEMPKVEAARVGRTLDVFGLHNLVFQDVGEERWHWASWSGIITFWLLAPMSVLGLRQLRRSHRWLLILPCLCVLATTLAFYGTHRIRSSMEPMVVLGAAIWLAQLSIQGAVPGSRRGSAARSSSSSRSASGSRPESPWRSSITDPNSSTTASNAGL